MDINNSNLLFVDAEISVLESIRRMLLESDKKANFASSADEAMEILNKGDIDVMFIDITSGNLSELLEPVQNAFPSVVKVVVSDFSHLSHIINSIRKYNLFSFMLKPWKKHDLFETIESAEEYSVYVKNMEREKENLEQKNVIYQRIINFKDDVGEYNKLDINSLKSCISIQSKEYTNLIESDEKVNVIKLKSIENATEILSSAFPTFIEKFTATEFISCLLLSKTDIKCDDIDKTYSKNLTLIKELISKLHCFVSSTFKAKTESLQLLSDDDNADKFIIDYKFEVEEIYIDDVKYYLDYLNSLLETLNCKMEYTVEKSNVSLNFEF